MKFDKYNINVPEDVPLNKPQEINIGRNGQQPKEQIRKLWTSQTEIKEKKKEFINHVCVIGIETSKYCNRKCSYCPDAIPKYNRNKQTLMSEKI